MINLVSDILYFHELNRKKNRIRFKLKTFIKILDNYYKSNPSSLGDIKPDEEKLYVNLPKLLHFYMTNTDNVNEIKKSLKYFC